MKVILHVPNARGIYLVKEGFDGCRGCAFYKASHQVCDSIGGYLVEEYPDAPTERGQNLGGCLMPHRLLVEDTPEGIMNYLAYKENEDYDEEEF